VQFLRIRRWTSIATVVLSYFLVVGFLRLAVGMMRMWMSVKYAESNPPVAILVLGGDAQRERYAVERLNAHPLITFISSGSLVITDPVFEGRRDMVQLDRRAVDTLTNFSTMSDVFIKRRFRHVLVITSSYHIPRAKAIGRIVLGCSGISSTYEASDSNVTDVDASTRYLQSSESYVRTSRDVLRALFWAAYRVDGRMMSSMFQNARPYLVGAQLASSSN